MADVPPLSREERLEAWRKRCFLEPLPEDFLRESTSSSSSSAHRQPVSAPVGYHQRRHHHHHHPHGGYSYPVQFGQGEHFGNIQGYLRITVQQVRHPSPSTCLRLSVELFWRGFRIGPVTGRPLPDLVRQLVTWERVTLVALR